MSRAAATGSVKAPALAVVLESKRTPLDASWDWAKYLFDPIQQIEEIPKMRPAREIRRGRHPRRRRYGRTTQRVVQAI
jgi:hypothetical protein